MAKLRLCAAAYLLLLQLWVAVARHVERGPQAMREDTVLNCNIAKGRWVKTSKGKAYHPFVNMSTRVRDGSPEAPWCSFADNTAVSKHALCRNGEGSEAWSYKWLPTRCEMLPIYGPWLRKFAQRKHIAFVGDSIMELQYKSLQCMMRNNMQHIHFYPTTRFGAEPDSNGVVELADASIKKVFSQGEGRNFTDYGIIVINVGHAFEQKGVKHMFHGQPVVEAGGDDLVEAYRIALKRVLRQMDKAVYRSMDVLLMSWIPKHPKREGNCAPLEPLHLQKVDKVNKMLEDLAGPGGDPDKEHVRKYKFRIRILDVTDMTLKRPDGHPGKQSSGASEDIDCANWCAPGLPDTWNRAVSHSLHIIADQRSMTV